MYGGKDGGCCVCVFECVYVCVFKHSFPNIGWQNALHLMISVSSREI